MKTRALLALVIATALTGAVAGYLLLGPGGGTPPQPQKTIEQALTRFVADRFGVGYVGGAPGSSQRTATSIGVCAPRGSLAQTGGWCIAWAIRSVSGSGRPRSSAMHPGPGMWRDSRSIHPSAPTNEELADQWNGWRASAGSS